MFKIVQQNTHENKIKEEVLKDEFNNLYDCHNAVFDLNEMSTDGSIYYMKEV